MPILTPTNISPNVANFYLGRGVVTWTRDGGGARDLGNATAFQLKPAIKSLDHFSSRRGTKIKDRSVTLEANMTVVIKLDEWTSDNLAMALMGPEGGGGGDIMSFAEITGGFNFVGANSVGPKISINLPYVSISPTGNLDFISADKWGEIEISGDVLALDPNADPPSLGTWTWVG